MFCHKHQRQKSPVNNGAAFTFDEVEGLGLLFLWKHKTFPATADAPKLDHLIRTMKGYNRSVGVFLITT